MRWQRGEGPCRRLPGRCRADRHRADRHRRRAPAAASLRGRAPGERARAPLRAAHRRLRRDGEAPVHPRGHHLQPHVLLRGQGRAARCRLRAGSGVRAADQQEAQDHERDEDQRRLRADATRPAGPGAGGRQGRLRGGAGRRPAGAAGDRGLQQSHPHQRQRGGRDRSGRAGDRLGRRPVREGRPRPQGQQRLAQPGRAEREPEGEGPAGGRRSGRSRGTSRTTTCSRWPTRA